jgi:hypothetical protein
MSEERPIAPGTELADLCSSVQRTATKRSRADSAICPNPAAEHMPNVVTLGYAPPDIQDSTQSAKIDIGGKIGVSGHRVEQHHQCGFPGTRVIAHRPGTGPAAQPGACAARASLPHSRGPPSGLGKGGQRKQARSERMRREISSVTRSRSVIGCWHRLAEASSCAPARSVAAGAGAAPTDRSER